MRTIDMNDGYLVDAPDPLDFYVNKVGAAPIAGDLWPLNRLLAADLVAAAIAFPLALVLLATSSSAESNSLSKFWGNVGSDASFPVAAVAALALAGFYRSSRRAQYESNFSELKELAIALWIGCVLSIGFSVLLHLTFNVNESNSTQLSLAAIIAIALSTIAHATLSALSRYVHSRVPIVGSGSQVDRITTYFNPTKRVEVVERGSFIRRTGLDEIPKFIIFILGDMSIVGPRPFTECESETLAGRQAQRFELRPGITGLWQVSGRNDLSMDNRRRLDYPYVAGWSLWRDLKIVWHTPGAMPRGFGAY